MFSLGRGLVGIVGSMGGKNIGWFGGDGLIVGWDYPEASGGVAFAYQHELGLAVDLTILFGEEDVTAIVAKLLDGEERRMCQAGYNMGEGGGIT